ncbi:hypothetical protein BC628DRAFT_705740 [Trametes gibbosa]|nr:hypothetical protein BC628DRAFT_705740 [Trametes gibbosa]
MPRTLPTDIWRWMIITLLLRNSGLIYAPSALIRSSNPPSSKTSVRTGAPHRRTFYCHSPLIFLSKRCRGMVTLNAREAKASRHLWHNRAAKSLTLAAPRPRHTYMPIRRYCGRRTRPSKPCCVMHAACTNPAIGDMRLFRALLLTSSCLASNPRLWHVFTVRMGSFAFAVVGGAYEYGARQVRGKMTQFSKGSASGYLYRGSSCLPSPHEQCQRTDIFGVHGPSAELVPCFFPGNY